MTKNDDVARKANRNKVTQRDIFTREEKHRFMKSIENFEELIMARLGFNGGLRVSEIVNLCVKDVLIDDTVLHIRDSKRNKSRYACIDRATVQLLACYAKDRGLGNDDTFFTVTTTRALQKRFKKILKRSGITRINPTPHTMRHTNITMLLEKGMELEQVKEHAGHDKISTTMDYTHLTYHTRARRYDEIMGE